ncbi:unnamed protein product [Linum tenue]|uniref:Uncharacterized protein n=1 Tax=Linum tenue TaxID=586396 RepID=A0AAV0JDW6_9ROSI|nr:unnamed protein product [Linum tenue]
MWTRPGFNGRVYGHRKQHWTNTCLSCHKQQSHN